jgi:endonuclease/exonuclease/phosphatase (EEP) superfamily protein YafD
MSTRLRRIASAILVLGVAGACFATALGFAGEWHWYFDQFSHFRPQYVVFLFAAVPLLLKMRRWVLAAVASAGFGVNLAVMLPHARGLPGAEDALGEQKTLRLVSLNLLQGNTHLDTVAEFVRSSNADVIVFQEVTPASAEVLRGLADVYPGQLIRGRKHSKGTAILTRLPATSLRFEPTPGQELIGAIVGDLEGPGARLR